jgi:hypothetical protein
MNARAIAASIVVLAVGAVVDAHAQSSALLSRVDHIVYGAPTLSAGIERLERLLGVRATPGGQHPGAGTRNALIALGPTVYLEILAPDPEQTKPDSPRRFGLDDLVTPRLVAWAAKGSDLHQIVNDARRASVNLGDVTPGNRRTPDGAVLSWHVTDQRARIADGIAPFFIDWGDTPHPATTAAAGATLLELRAEHPDAAGVQRILSTLGFDFHVTPGVKPALVAIIASPRGRIELR